VLMLTGLTSCGDIEQNLKLNPDGSGTLETSFDVGEMMSMVKGMGEMSALENDDVTISPDQPVDSSLIKTEEPKDPMELIIEKVTDPAYGRDFDTLISFVSIMPDSVRQKETRMDLVQKINLRMRSPANSSSLVMGVVMNFDNKAQLDELIKYLEDMDDASSTAIMPSMGGGGMQKETFLVFDADMKAGWIRLDTVDYSALAPEVGMSADSLSTGDDMAMMEMMFGNSKIKSIIQVPGEVTSCTNKNAIITKDNKVIVEQDFLDVIKKGKVPGYTIYFTPKK
ncbi:MAG: hypothetical protein IPL92_15875, partial [Saprospiraceae bacterium]|nr:hypothetical protein [Candidatus Opimibacter iunctus]